MTEDADARTVLSEMIEITETTIDQTFHRHADLDALYRDCPTAFWLAPDADLSIPPSAPTVRRIAARPELAPIVVKGRAVAIAVALVAAGPTFTALMVGLHELSPGEPWSQRFARAAVSLMLTPFTLVVGGLLGLIPIVLGTLVLGKGGALQPVLRRPGIWLAAGGAVGAGIAALSDAGGPIGLCLIVTSLVCAGIARSLTHWERANLA